MGDVMSLRFLFVLVNIWVLIVAVETKKEVAAEFCPVCDTVLNAIRNIVKNDKKIKLSDALHKYCKIDSLDVDHVKFCYDIDPMKRDLLRILDLGATNDRVCKKVQAMNKDFCLSKQSSSDNAASYPSPFEVPVVDSGNPTSVESNNSSSGAYVFPPNFKPKRGFIYI